MTIDSIKELRTHVGDFSQSQTAMEKVEANKLGDLPSEIIFECEPYLDFKPRKFKVRVSVITTRAEPSLSLKIVRHEAIEEELAEEFLEKIAFALNKKKITAYIGKV